MNFKQLYIRFLLVLAVAFSITTQFQAADYKTDRPESVSKSSFSGSFLPFLGGILGFGCATLRKSRIDAQLSRVQGLLLRATPSQGMKLKGGHTSEFQRLILEENQLFKKQSEAISPWQGALIGSFAGTIVVVNYK